MNRPTIASVFVLALLAAVAGAAAADSGVPFVGQIEFAAVGEASLVMRPDGAGPPFTEARLLGGIAVDATIRVQLVDINFLPIQGFPADDIWLQFAVDPGTAHGCRDYGPAFPGGVFVPDATTDADGWTQWVAPMRGGGWSAGPVLVYLNGSPAMGPDLILHPPVALRTNSPDINGDLEVDLTDIVLFIQGFLDEYRYSSDYNWDGMVNISDISMFAQAIGVSCP